MNQCFSGVVRQSASAVFHKQSIFQNRMVIIEIHQISIIQSKEKANLDG
ncbi:MAG: hypothetical protein J6B80_02870 [Clostridia bacterium]|nr:hypothetical protein [Clostridia bacterium]